MSYGGQEKIEQIHQCEDGRQLKLQNKLTHRR